MIYMRKKLGVLYGVVRGECKRIYDYFEQNQPLIYAASLSYYSIFALIPLLLVFFSILLSLPQFQSEVQHIKEMLLSNLVPTNSDVFSQYLDTFIQNGSKLGMMGLAYVLATSILFFRNFEYVSTKMFNSKPRGFLDSIIVYWTMITLFPISLALSIYFSGEVQKTLKGVADFSFLFEILPYFITWVMFFLLFKISANKRLPFISLSLSSFLSTAVWLITKWGFMYYIFYNQTYKSMYGQISILLFLMLWIYISWFIVLCGMRFCEGFSSDFGRNAKGNLA